MERLIENFAYAFPHSLIAEAFQVPQSTVSTWKARKDIRYKIAQKKLEILQSPLKAVAERFPLQFIERHPDTRETYAPPTSKTQVEQVGAFPTLVNALLAELASRYDREPATEVEYQEVEQIEHRAEEVDLKT